MGFNNGYDAGWQDAINAVKYGKVPGLGPASVGGGAASAPAPTYMTNAANRYATVVEGSARVRYAAPESMTAVMNGTAFDLQVPTGVPAGTVMNVNLTFEYKDPEIDGSVWEPDSGSAIGVDAITVNEATPSGMPENNVAEFIGMLDLVLWYDGVSWVCIATEFNL